MFSNVQYTDARSPLTLMVTVSWGLPRCKNLTRFSLFVGFCFAVRYCLKCFCFLCFTSSVSFTGSYTEVKPLIFQDEFERIMYIGGKIFFIIIQLLYAVACVAVSNLLVFLHKSNTWSCHFAIVS